MAISENAFVRLDYTGRVKETGNVFDTTSEDVAEEANIKNPEKDYHPMVLAVGSSQLIPKLHEEIQKLDVGQKQTVEIPCEDAFGKRDPSLIRLIPMKEFKKQGIKPFVGMPLTLEGNPGIVRTVDGGRVRVDFNHELAGKDIVYDLEIIEEITDNEEKIKGLIEVYYGNPNLNMDEVKIDFEDDVAKINLGLLAGFDQRTAQEVTLSKFRVARETYENIAEIEKVQFIEEFEDKKSEAEEENEEDIPEVLNEDEE